MATVTLESAQQTFDMSSLLVTYTGGTVQFADPDVWQWQSADSSHLTFQGTNGTGLTYTGGVPDGGTVSVVGIFLGPSFAVSLQVFGLSIDFGLFAHMADGTLNAEQQNNLYWRTILSGDDEIYLGANATAGSFTISFSGDGRFVEAGQTIFGGNDTITGDAGTINPNAANVQGDFHDVLAGASVYGGDDTITVSAGVVHGDAFSVSGFLAGGDDIISVQADGSVSAIRGDAENVGAGGSVVGGNDTINADGAVFATGDIDYVYGNLVGGNDMLTGGNAGEIFAGDAYEIYAGGSLRGGADTIRGGGGDDSIDGDWTILDAGGQARGGNDSLFGDAGNDTINGNGGNDQIHGGGDADQMLGGDGNDILFIDAVTDLVVGETYDGGNGQDELQIGNGGAAYAVDLRDVAITSIETLRFGSPGTGGLAVIALLENQVGSLHTILGNADASVADYFDVVSLGSGVMDLSGFDFQNFGQANDLIRIFGNGAAETITGTMWKEQLYGREGADTLNGGAGSDYLDGGADDDTYVLGADTTDTIVDESGNDTITSTITRTLASYSMIENLTLLGTANLNATGNNLANVITGNSGNNSLNGGAGADTLDGGAGNDTYVFGGFANDTIVDSSGTDTITTTTTRSLATYTMIENLTLTGSSAADLTGNSLDNVLTGNSAANILTGGAGADTLNGGDGSDTYVFGGYANDTIIDSSGIDTITSTITRSLGSYGMIENLTLLGSSAINGTGNSLDNVLTGNSATNILSGGGGSDTLIGGSGNDTLTGGSGQNFFVFNTTFNSSTNVDTITDFNVADDTIRLDNAIFTAFTSDGAIASTMFRSNTTGNAQDGDDFLIYESDTGELYYDSNGSASGGSHLIARLATGLSLTSNDFVIV